MIGQTIGGYTIAKKLRDTPESEVFLAEHRRISRTAVVEIWRAELLTDRQAAARFITALRALSALGHPGVVELYEAELEHERLFAVSEVLEGQSLAAILARVGNLASEALVAVAITRQIAGALAAAHQIGVFHGRVRTEDVMVVINAAAKSPVIVKALNLGRSMLGPRDHHTPPSAQSDCLAVGALLFELLTGKLPSPGCPPPSAHQPGISRRLDGLVNELLSSPSDAAQGETAATGSAAAPPRTMAWVCARLDSALEEGPSPVSRKLVAAGSSVVVAPLVEPPPDRQLPVAQLPVAQLPVANVALAGPEEALPPAPLAEAEVSAALVDRPPPLSRQANLTPPVNRTLLLTGDDMDAPRALAAPALRTSSPPRSREPRGRPPKRFPRDLPGGWRWLAGLGMAIATVGVAGALTASGPARSHRPVREARLPSSETAQPASAQPASVDLRISSTPPGAELTVSDEVAARGVTPLMVTLPRGSKTVDLRLTAPGYLDKVLAADVSTDHLVEVDLTPLPAPVPTATAMATPPEAPPPASPAASAGAAAKAHPAGHAHARSTARSLPKGHASTAKPATGAPRAQFYPMGD